MNVKNYIRVALSGRRANRDAIGARVSVYHDGQSQTRYVRTGSSFLSQSELPLTFGIPATAKVDSLVVHWPGGTQSTYVEPDMNELIVIEESES
ncbi:MAG: hypothetical protein HKN43_16720 [Rhodothermales bacterium]|nr:hypothetical protein [Rhodothermales bacterium]